MIFATEDIATSAGAALGVYAGVVLQGILLTWRERSMFRHLATAICLSLIVFLAPKQSGDRHATESAVIAAAAIFTVIFGFTFIERIFLRINSQVLIHASLLFLYGLAVIGVTRGIIVEGPVLWLAMIPIGLAAAPTFSTWKPGPIANGLFYLWFIFVELALLLLVAFLCFPAEGIFHGVLNGMLFFFLILNAGCLLAMLPVPDKKQSVAEAIDERKEAFNLLGGKYSEGKLDYRAGAMVLIHGTFLAINYHLALFPHWLVINLLLLLTMEYASYAGQSLKTTA